MKKFFLEEYNIYDQINIGSYKINTEEKVMT